MSFLEWTPFRETCWRELRLVMRTSKTTELQAVNQLRRDLRREDRSNNPRPLTGWCEPELLRLHRL